VVIVNVVRIHRIDTTTCLITQNECISEYTDVMRQCIDNTHTTHMPNLHIPCEYTYHFFTAGYFCFGTRILHLGLQYCLIYEMHKNTCVISPSNETCHIRISHVTHKWIMSHIYIYTHVFSRTHVMHKNVTRRSMSNTANSEWVMSRTNESCRIYVYIYTFIFTYTCDVKECHT